MKEGYCLVSQQIRNKIERGGIITTSNLSRKNNGFFKDNSLESRVQPSSFEPIIGDEIYILDIEEQAVFSPGPHETVYRALLHLPKRQRLKASIMNGFECKTGKKGYTYLVPLEERTNLCEGERIKSSPKSSTGRLFPKVRMIADYNHCFDEIHYQYKTNEPLQMWLLIQPGAFNVILRPNLTLTQLRFLTGLNVSLNQEEIIKEFEKHALFSSKDVKPIITDDGLQIRLNLTGEYTNKIVALRARRNPMAIELSKAGLYNAEEFFEPIENKKGKIKLYNGESYLMASKEILDTPAHLSAELRRYYGSGMRGTWDEAGFVDPGFKGDLVFEVSITETGGITLDEHDERLVSALEFFRTNQIPDKLYGEENTGSHYQGQVGPRVSKHFKQFDFARAARDYRKLDREVLVHDARVLNNFRETKEMFEFISPKVANKLLKEIEERGFFHSRYDCEDDEGVLQVIPYVLLFGKENDYKRIFTYVRATNIKDYGDKRLFGKYSIGLGGHIQRADGPNYIEKCLEREVMGEEVNIKGEYTKPKLVGTIMAYHTPVDKVHFGLIYTSHVKGKIIANESSITSFGMKTFETLKDKVSFEEFNSDIERKAFETWSKILIPLLPKLYKSDF